MISQREAVRLDMFEDVGVQLVENVEPYDLMKFRLLNDGHQQLCCFAHLCGYVFVQDAAQDSALSNFVRGYMGHEATLTLDSVSGVDLEQYKATLIERFRNPELGDAIAGLCAESSNWISNRELFGDLIDDQRIVDSHLDALRSLHEIGARATLVALADGPRS